ncbi:hypothetical protein VTI74DRAFT_9217 [Chaetomium olivicolor]
MGRGDAELIDLLPDSVKVFASAGAGFDWADTRQLGNKEPILHPHEVFPRAEQRHCPIGFHGPLVTAETWHEQHCHLVLRLP